MSGVERAAESGVGAPDIKDLGAGNTASVPRTVSHHLPARGSHCLHRTDHFAESHLKHHYVCCYVALSCYWARPPQLTVSTTFRSLSVKAESSAEAESIDKASKSSVAVFGSWSRSRDFHGSCCINLSIFNRMTLTVGQIVTPGKSISQTGWLVDSSEVMVGLI